MKPDSLRMIITQEEKAFLKKISQQLDETRSNLLIECIRCGLEARGLEIPPGLFDKRRQGKKIIKDEE